MLDFSGARDIFVCFGVGQPWVADKNHHADKSAPPATKIRHFQGNVRAPIVQCGGVGRNQGAYELLLGNILAGEPGRIQTGRVERRRDMIRPMTSNGSALSSIVANGHQAIHFVSSAPSIHSVRRVFPQYGWKSALSSCALPNPVQASFDAGAAVHPFLAISYATIHCRGRTCTCKYVKG